MPLILALLLAFSNGFAALTCPQLLHELKASDPIFDGFTQNLNSGTNGFKISKPKNFVSEMLGLGKFFSIAAKAKWKRIIKDLNPQTGALARSKTERAISYQYRLYSTLQKAIEFYNESNPKPLKVKDLATEKGIRKIIETLRGEALPEVKQNPLLKELGPMPEPGQYPSLDGFRIHFKAATKDLKIGSPKNFAPQMKTLSKRFSNKRKGEWDELVDGMSPQTGNQARSTSPYAAGQQYILYGAFKKAVEFYNENNPKKALSVSDLGTEEGIRNIIKTLLEENP